MSWDDDFFNFDFFFNDDHSQKRGGTGNWHSSKSAYHFKEDKPTVHVNRRGKLFWVIFVLLVVSLFIFIKTCNEKKYMALGREKAAINKIDKLLNKPYYAHKSDFDAQKKLMHPALKGLQIDMPFSNKEMKEMDLFRDASFSGNNFNTNSFLLSGYESEDSIMGTTDYFFSGNHENGKLLKMHLQFDYQEDGKDIAIVEKIKKWAGKGCYITYNTYERKNEYEWQYQNANIKLTYSSSEYKCIFLTIEQPGIDFNRQLIDSAKIEIVNPII